MAQLERILVLGAYGSGNWGDELILRSISALLGEAYPGSEIRALSYDPGYTARFWDRPSIRLEPYRPLRTLLSRVRHRQWQAMAVDARARWQTDRALEWAQLLVLGGGNLLVDHPHYFLEHFSGQVVARAAGRGRPVALLGVGYGPVQTRRGAAILQRLAREWACMFVVREQAAAEALTKAGAARVHLVADPVLLAPPAVPARSSNGRTVYGLSARPLPWDASPVATLRVLAETLRGQASLRGLAFHPDMDLPVLSEAIQTAEITDARSPLALAEALSTCAVVVGMRLHSLVLAAAYGIPMLGLAYHDKVLGFLSLLGAGSAVDLRPERFDAGLLQRRLRMVVEEREAERGRVRAASLRLRRRGLQDLHRALGELPFAAPAADCWSALRPAEAAPDGPIAHDRPVCS